MPVATDNEPDHDKSVSGTVRESLPNAMFRVELDNGDKILPHISGKVRKANLQLKDGDRVRVMLTKYDMTRGRIISKE